MKRLLRLFLAAGALLVPTGSVSAAVVFQDGCDIVLAHPSATFADVERLDDADDGWSTEEVTAGILDLTLDTGGIQYAPGHYVIRWDGDPGDVDLVMLACEPPPINADQDPAEADVCNWPEPGVIVEGCELEVTAAGEISTTGPIDRATVPPTDTAGQTGARSVPVSSIASLLLAFVMFGGALVVLTALLERRLGPDRDLEEPWDPSR